MEKRRLQFFHYSLQTSLAYINNACCVLHLIIFFSVIFHLPFNFQYLFHNSPYCLSYNYNDGNLENLVSDQLVIP